jgi:creatinine amidohydrolase
MRKKHQPFTHYALRRYDYRDDHNNDYDYEKGCEPMSLRFIDQAWPDLTKAVKKNTLILLPLGQVEEHGEHLPVSTDYVIAQEVAARVAEAAAKKIPLLLMPTIWTGYSQAELAQWPGTIRLRTRTLMDLLFDVCASLIEMGFRKIVILNSHGHHPGIINVVLRELSDRFGNVFCASAGRLARPMRKKHLAVAAIANLPSMCKEEYAKLRTSAPGGSIHGGEWETSLMLALNQPVNMKKATKRDIFKYSSPFVPLDNFSGSKKVDWSTWAIQKSKTGIYGDPTAATRALGEAMIEAMVENACKFLVEYYRH